MRRDGLKYNPIRDVTPLEQDRDRTARALSVEEIRDWLAILDKDPVARRKDLPELGSSWPPACDWGRRSACVGATSTWIAAW